MDLRSTKLRKDPLNHLMFFDVIEPVMFDAPDRFPDCNVDELAHELDVILGSFDEGVVVSSKLQKTVDQLKAAVRKKVGQTFSHLMGFEYDGKNYRGILNLTIKKMASKEQPLAFTDWPLDFQWTAICCAAYVPVLQKIIMTFRDALDKHPEAGEKAVFNFDKDYFSQGPLDKSSLVQDVELFEHSLSEIKGCVDLVAELSGTGDDASVILEGRRMPRAPLHQIVGQCFLAVRVCHGPSAEHFLSPMYTLPEFISEFSSLPGFYDDDDSGSLSPLDLVPKPGSPRQAGKDLPAKSQQKRGWEPFDPFQALVPNAHPNTLNVFVLPIKAGGAKYIFGSSQPSGSQDKSAEKMEFEALTSIPYDLLRAQVPETLFRKLKRWQGVWHNQINAVETQLAAQTGVEAKDLDQVDRVLARGQAKADMGRGFLDYSVDLLGEAAQLELEKAFEKQAKLGKGKRPKKPPTWRKPDLEPCEGPLSELGMPAGATVYSFAYTTRYHALKPPCLRCRTAYRLNFPCASHQPGSFTAMLSDFFASCMEVTTAKMGKQEEFMNICGETVCMAILLAILDHITSESQPLSFVCGGALISPGGSLSTDARAELTRTIEGFAGRTATRPSVGAPAGQLPHGIEALLADPAAHVHAASAGITALPLGILDGLMSETEGKRRNRTMSSVITRTYKHWNEVSTMQAIKESPFEEGTAHEGATTPSSLTKPKSWLDSVRLRRVRSRLSIRTMHGGGEQSTAPGDDQVLSENVPPATSGASSPES